MTDTKFDRWISELREDVVQGEYGYEEGEFSVYPEMWRSLFDEGLTPSQAFKRALDAHAEARCKDEAERQANWERIQIEDAKYLSPITQTSAMSVRQDQQITSIEGEAV